MYRFRDTLPIDISRKTISGDLVQIDNSDEMGVVDSLKVALSPIQDLNGYDKPWVGGAGKNLWNGSNGYWGASNGEWSTSGTAIKYQSSQKIKVSEGDTFYVASDKDMQQRYIISWLNGEFVEGKQVSNSAIRPYTVPSGVDEIAIDLDFGSQALAKEAKVMMNRGSTAEPFEPYSNICPISGRTEVVTHRTGKNLLPSHNVGTASLNGLVVTYKSDGAVTVNGTATANTDIPIYNSGNVSKGLQGSFILSGSTGGSASTYRLVARIRNTSASTNRYVAIPNGDQTIETATNEVLNNVYITINNGTTLSNKTFYPMIRLASDTDATYEPYNGQTYTTALGRTVYGGTLDVVSGVLTVTHAMIDMGGLTWTYSNSFFRTDGITATVKRPPNNQTKVNAICSAYPIMTWTATSGTYTAIAVDTTGRMIVANPNITSLSDFQTAINGVQLCYELATPQTIQLTPQEVQLLLGTNNVWSDGGEVSVTWHRDLKKIRILPTEACSINGQYLEDVVDGYRTLYTKGRESLGAKLETYSIGTADGEKFKNKRYPARTITVGFQLIGANPQDFRQKFNNLNNLLSIDEADFIFNDETDKFFSGYPIMDASVEAGQDSVKGEWKIYCTYPFKRSVEPIKLTMEDATVTDTTATFTIDYKGARPARPVLRAKFAGAKSGGSSSEDGDCGFVAFMDGEENIIQLGNPEIVDLDEYVSAETLLNKEFVNVSDWTRTGGHTYKGTVTGSVSTSDTVDAFWNGGAGQTQTYAKPSYGSGSDLHGAILWKNTAGAVNFTMNMVHRLCCANPSETGVFECGAYNHETGVLVAGFVIDKSANGTTGVVRYIVNGVQVGTDQIDLSYYNTHFGYCNRTPVYVEETVHDPYIEEYVVIKRHKKRKRKQRKYITKSRVHWWARTRTVFGGWNYSQSNLNSSIQKDGSYVYFQVGNLPMRTFNVPAVAQVIAHDASVYMGTYGTALNTNMIHSLLFRREAGVPFSEQPNVFTAGDIVEADCNEATVYIYRDGSIGGHLEPQYGALGNDWEDFMLTSGTNVIRATWSEWVNPTYKPQIEIEYNEVYI